MANSHELPLVSHIVIAGPVTLGVVCVALEQSNPVYPALHRQVSGVMQIYDRGNYVFSAIINTRVISYVNISI